MLQSDEIQYIKEYSISKHYTTLKMDYSYFIAEFRLALVQLAVGASKSDNLTRAAKLVSEAAKQGAKIVSLPVSHTSF